MGLIEDDEIEWPKGTVLSTKAFVRAALRKAAALAKPTLSEERVVPTTGPILYDYLFCFHLPLCAGANAATEDVATRFQESIIEAFGWKSGVKFEFIDIGAELEKRKLRDLFPVEVSISIARECLFCNN